MPLTKLQFKPGINREVTSYSNEGGWRDCDKIRFRFGYPEKMGGWQKYTSSTYLGTVRALHNWVALDGSDYLGLGSHIKYYIEEGGQLNDITPVRSITSQGDVTFAATNGSSTITVTDISHGASESDFVTFTNAETLGGNITAAVLNQEYQINNVLNANTYEITAKNPTTGASVNANSSDTGVGGNGVGGVTITGTAVAASGIDAVTVTTNATGVGALTFSNPSSTGVGNFTVSGASTGSATTTNVVQTSTSGIGTSAEFTVVASSGDYTVTVTSVGSGYAVGDTILIEGQNVGGTQTTNDITLTITHLQGASVGTATHTNEAQTATSGSGSNAQFTVTTDGNGGYDVAVTTVGSNYAVGDTITIAGTGIGGTSPANDIVLTVTQLSGTSIGTATHTGKTQTSTSGSGSSAEFTVVTDGSGGYAVTVTALGSGYAVNDTVTISGANLGGSSPANDLTFTINSLVSVTYTDVPQPPILAVPSGPPLFGVIPIGTGAKFTVTRDGSGTYSVDAITAIGTDYKIGNKFYIRGSQLGGSDSTNDALITVTSFSHPTIATYQVNVGLDTTVGGTGWGAGLYYGVTNGAAQTTLNQGGTLSSSATTVTVTTSAPGGHQIVINDVIQVEDELMLVTNVSSNNLTVIRGFDGTGTGATNNVNTLGPTAAKSHADGSVVRLALGNADSTNDFSGWGVAASGGLTTTTQIRLWSHDNFGEDLLLNPRDDQIYYWDRTTNLNSRAIKLNTRSGTKLAIPTKCKQVLVSDRDRHVIAFGADDIVVESPPTQENGNGVQDPLLIRFSSQENPLIWYPLATNTAGSLRLGSGSTFMQAVETKREILVWTDTALTSMSFIGPPFTFGLQQLSSNITIMSPNAAAATEDFVFWMGIDTFYIYDGRTQTLPCSVKDKVFLDFNLEQKDKVTVGVNTEFSEVIWFYPSSGASDNDRYVTFNYNEKVWYFGTLSRTAWLDRGTRNFPIATGNNLIYNHELGYDDDGSAMNSFIESATMDIGDGDKFAYLNKVIPDLTFDGSTSLSSPQATFTLKSRSNPGADFDSTASGTTIRTQSSPVEEYTEQLDLRVRGRSFALRVESNAIGSKWKLGSPRVNIRQDGRR